MLMIWDGTGEGSRCRVPQGLRGVAEAGGGDGGGDDGGEGGDGGGRGGGDGRYNKIPLHFFGSLPLRKLFHFHDYFI